MGQASAIARGATALAQLHLSEPVATVWSQPFVIRSESPVITIGGGRVLVPDASKIRRLDQVARGHLVALSEADELKRAGAAIFFAEPGSWQPRDLARLAGVRDVTHVIEQLKERGIIVTLPISPQQSLLVHGQVASGWQDKVVRQLDRLHDEHPMQSLIETSQLVHAVTYLGNPMMIEALLRGMAESEIVRLTKHGVGLADRQPKLTLAQKQLLASLVGAYQETRFQPPTIKELEQKYPKQCKEIAKLVQLAVSEGDLKHVAADMFLHTDAEQEMRAILHEALSAGKGMTLSGIRELLGTTRKYAVPFCEYLDKIGFTRRQGDLRLLASSD